MAKRDRASPAKRKPRARDEARARAVTPAVEAPAFWFGFEVAWGKLVCARFVIFTMLAVDAMLQIAHAPRYGTGFNVAQLPLLDALGPTRITYLVGELVNAVLLALAAVGVATRIAVPLAAAIYAWLYFGSQLDSYQHHYLVAIVLVIAAFVPWERPADARPSTPVRSWALRLILVQLGIMYLWAAVSKLDAAWLDGRTLGAQLTGTMRGVIAHTVGFAFASKVVVVVELALAATIWNKRTWVVAAPLGIAFHAGIIASGLEIGLFAWLMLALYLLVVPDRPWRALDRWFPRAVVERSRVAGALVAAGAACALICRFPHVRWIALVALVVPVALRRAPLRAAAGYLYAFALMLVVDRASSIAVDYYVRWGSAERRFGELASAETAYRKLVTLAPDEERSHFLLAHVLLARDQGDAGLAELHEAERLEPARPRAYMEEARWLAAHGQRAAAIDKAKEATYADPNNQGARDLLDTLTGKRRTATPPPDDSDSP